MAKELVAILVTDNNGEAFHNYTGTGAGQTTFIAESGELESNSLTINDINQELTITADKNILSYADNDTATLTATLTENNNPIQGENIYIYNNPDNIEFDQMLYGPLYFPCIRLKLEGDGVMTFPGGRGLIINLYNSNNQYIDSMGLSTEKWSIISSNGEILLKNETQNYTTNFASFTQYFIIEIGINAQNQTDYPTITSSTFSTFIETITTDSNGVATYTYNSQGVGDVTITAKCMNLQETFVVQDTWKYDSSVHSTEAEVVNWDLPNGDFEITAYIERGTGGAFIQVGSNSNSDRVLFGHTSSNSNFKLMCGSNEYSNGSGNNTDHTLKIINGVAYYTVNGNTISQSAPTGLTHKLYQFAPWGNGKISNIRIKPL